MITLDKLKIVAPIEYITITDTSEFEMICNDGGVLSMRYHKEHPYLLNIKADYVCGEVVIEFTGKILGSDYQKLISIETIHQCFLNINNLGICNLDVNGIVKYGEVVKCDVTSDVRCNDVPKLCAYIRGHITSYNQFKCSQLRNGNLILEKNVCSDKCKKRMTIYDKGKEMSRATNRDFVTENALEGKFDGMCRFELNLNSKEQIRSALGIADTSLMSVLASTENPIASLLEQSVALEETSSIVRSNLKTEMRYLFLKDCDFDMEKVEARLRSYDNHRNVRQNLLPFRELCDSLRFNEGTDMYREILSQLR